MLPRSKSHPTQQLMYAADLESFAGDPNFMMSLARGLTVLRAFSAGPHQSISQMAKLTGLSRAAVRRCLYTLERLGFVSNDQGRYALAPRVLTLGHAYLASDSLATLALPVLTRLRDALHESCSLGVLDRGEVLYLARAETRRIISIALRVGSRLPAYCTSMGRVLLAHIDPETLDEHVPPLPWPALTEHTFVTREALDTALASVREDGYAVVDQELEVGLRSIAVPVRDVDGTVVAALNMGAQASRLTLRALRETVAPALQAAAEELQAQMAHAALAQRA